jgi:hypothetical protein
MCRCTELRGNKKYMTGRTGATGIKTPKNTASQIWVKKVN